MSQRVYYGSVCQGTTGYGIVFLDFPGCISAGETMEELIAMAHEALQLHIDGMVETDDRIPEPSTVTLQRTIAELDDPADPIEGEEWVDVVPVLVEVRDRDAAVPVPIDASLLREVGRYAVDREKFIIDATRRELARLKKTA